jgi:hypothetical protein
VESWIVICIDQRAKTEISPPPAARRGVAALDYILVLGVVLPMALVILRIVPQIIRSAYEMVCVLISWPFL